MKQKVEFVKAVDGKKRVHIKNPIASNDISICRFCEAFEKSDKLKFNKSPCTVCLINYNDFVKFQFIRNGYWTR